MWTETGRKRKKRRADEKNGAGRTVKTVALAGNPNVGKSTVFNRLTGMHQHTGNWPGKTVATASGFFEYDGMRYRLVDIPGMYSLTPHSAEEEAAAEFLYFDAPDAVMVVCDAGALERHLPLVLQIAEMTDHLMVCVNLNDEAARRGIRVDASKLSALLGVPVVKTSAARGEGIDELVKEAARLCSGGKQRPYRVRYPCGIDRALNELGDAITQTTQDRGISGKNSARGTALKILENDEAYLNAFQRKMGFDIRRTDKVRSVSDREKAAFCQKGFTGESIAATVTTCRVRAAGSIAERCVTKDGSSEVSKGTTRSDRLDKLDEIFTRRVTGKLCMLALLAVVFWLTVAGANVPSAWLTALFAGLEPPLRRLLETGHIPDWLCGLLMDGIYRVVTWVVSVMLPPMAIFFPLFTLLEDAGYLPRVAFNLDCRFRQCGACGKQALTACMGFGCNAVGVTGCRIIDSPRERLIAILTNSFVPCNGRFPMLTALIAMFCVGSTAAPWDSLLGAVLLTGLICLGLAATFAVSKALSMTLLKGKPSSFTLELPPYRRPQVMSVIVRSVLDRTLFVLGRAVVAAAPAGAVIWLAVHLRAGDGNLLTACSGWLDTVGRLLGMDGVILLAFLLGFPANEIVIPLMLMMYLSQGTLTDVTDLTALHELLTANGWTLHTAVCVMLFSLMHWPCATTCMTIYKETGSFKWTAAAIVIPAAMGCAVCMAVSLMAKIIGF